LLTLHQLFFKASRIKMKKFQKTRLNLQRRLRSQASRGAVAVEFAICVPLLFVLLFGCYEMARANLMKHAAESAAYEGARVGIIPGASEEEIREATQFIMTSVGVSTFTVDVQNTVSEDGESEQVVVDVGIPFNENFRMGTFFIDDPTFRGQCALKRESL